MRGAHARESGQMDEPTGGVGVLCAMCTCRQAHSLAASTMTDNKDLRRATPGDGSGGGNF